jgi:BT4734-like, N-terminal domain
MVQNGTDTNTDHVTVAVILAGIRKGRWQKPVAHVKTRYLSALQAAKQQGNPDPYETAKEAVRAIKKKLAGVLFSGEFSQRANELIIAHSGLLCLDIDNLEDAASLKLALANDDHVQACFISPTGSGLKVLLRIAPDVTSHERSFLAAQKYFRERYGAKVDNCKDLARLCFVSHDENIFIRAEEATLLEPLPPEPKHEAAPPPRRDIDAELAAKCGRAYYITNKGRRCHQ